MMVMMPRLQSCRKSVLYCFLCRSVWSLCNPPRLLALLTALSCSHKWLSFLTMAYRVHSVTIDNRRALKSPIQAACRSPNFYWAKVICHDANSTEMTANKTSMQVTCLHIIVLAVSKHDIAYSVFPAIHFRVVMLFCWLLCSFSWHRPTFSASDFYLRQGWRKMRDHCSWVIVV